MNILDCKIWRYSMNCVKILFIISLFLFVSRLSAQELECEVQLLNQEQLSAESRENVADFVQQLKQYLNSTKYTKEDYGANKIKVQIQISLSGGTNDHHYTAQAVIVSQRPINKANRNTAVLRLKDDAWDFDYIRYQPLQRDE